MWGRWRQVDEVRSNTSTSGSPSKTRATQPSTGLSPQATGIWSSGFTSFGSPGSPISPELKPSASCDAAIVPSNEIGRNERSALPFPKFMLNGSLLKKAASLETTVLRIRSWRNVVLPLIATSAGRNHSTLALRRATWPSISTGSSSRSDHARTTAPSAGSCPVKPQLGSKVS